MPKCDVDQSSYAARDRVLERLAVAAFQLLDRGARVRMDDELAGLVMDESVFLKARAAIVQPLAGGEPDAVRCRLNVDRVVQLPGVVRHELARAILDHPGKLLVHCLHGGARVLVAARRVADDDLVAVDRAGGHRYYSFAGSSRRSASGDCVGGIRCSSASRSSWPGGTG